MESECFVRECAGASVCLNSSLGKPDNAGEKCFPCGLMLVDPLFLPTFSSRHLAAYLEKRDLGAPVSAARIGDRLAIE